MEGESEFAFDIQLLFVAVQQLLVTPTPSYVGTKEILRLFSSKKIVEKFKLILTALIILEEKKRSENTFTLRN
jgi:hypothetical protein